MGACPKRAIHAVFFKVMGTVPSAQLRKCFTDYVVVVVDDEASFAMAGEGANLEM
jgi:hypothetical protein